LFQQIPTSKQTNGKFKILVLKVPKMQAIHFTVVYNITTIIEVTATPVNIHGAKRVAIAFFYLAGNAKWKRM
jgi:hypothetical protein